MPSPANDNRFTITWFLEIKKQISHRGLDVSDLKVKFRANIKSKRPKLAIPKTFEHGFVSETCEDVLHVKLPNYNHIIRSIINSLITVSDQRFVASLNHILLFSVTPLIIFH